MSEAANDTREPEGLDDAMTLLHRMGRCLPEICPFCLGEITIPERRGEGKKE